MPNINIDDAYILNETGAQVDKVTGLFTKDEDTTSGEKAFAQLNIGTAGSNRNLLDNPFFTVNQRGVNGTITNGQYGLDRWMAGGGTVTMATGGITLGAGNSYAMQRPADPSIFNGKTVTLSVMTSDGVVESGTVVAQTGSAKTVRTANFKLCIGYTAYNSFYFYNTSSSAKTVIAAKLELGSISTLANDAPPDYETELLKCEYRCVVMNFPTNFLVGQGLAISATNLALTLPLPRDMATDKIPTISLTGSFITTTGHAITAIDAYAPPVKNLLKLNCTANGLSSGNLYIVYTNQSTPKLIISADL